MEIELRNSITNRKQIAEIISCIVQGSVVRDIPYTVNSGDECWTVDCGNDWHLKFFDEDDKKLRINYRYNNKETNNKEAALVSWLCQKLNAKVI